MFSVLLYREVVRKIDFSAFCEKFPNLVSSIIRVQGDLNDKIVIHFLLHCKNYSKKKVQQSIRAKILFFVKVTEPQMLQFDIFTISRIKCLIRQSSEKSALKELRD